MVADFTREAMVVRETHRESHRSRELQKFIKHQWMRMTFEMWIIKRQAQVNAAELPALQYEAQAEREDKLYETKQKWQHNHGLLQRMRKMLLLGSWKRVVTGLGRAVALTDSGCALKEYREICKPTLLWPAVETVRVTEEVAPEDWEMVHGAQRPPVYERTAGEEDLATLQRQIRNGGVRAQGDPEIREMRQQGAMQAREEARRYWQCPSCHMYSSVHTRDKLAHCYLFCSKCPGVEWSWEHRGAVRPPRPVLDVDLVAMDEFMKKSLVELRALAHEHGAVQAGNKNELAERLASELPAPLLAELKRDMLMRSAAETDARREVPMHQVSSAAEARARVGRAVSRAAAAATAPRHMSASEWMGPPRPYEAPEPPPMRGPVVRYPDGTEEELRGMVSAPGGRLRSQTRAWPKPPPPTGAWPKPPPPQGPAGPAVSEVPRPTRASEWRGPSQAAGWGVARATHRRLNGTPQTNAAAWEYEDWVKLNLGTSPIAARLGQRCMQCGWPINPGKPVLKLYALGWAHFQCIDPERWE